MFWLHLLANKKVIGIVVGVISGVIRATGVAPGVEHILDTIAVSAFTSGVTPSDKEAQNKIETKKIKEIISKDNNFLRTGE